MGSLHAPYGQRMGPICEFAPTIHTEPIWASLYDPYDTYGIFVGPMWATDPHGPQNSPIWVIWAYRRLMNLGCKIKWARNGFTHMGPNRFATWEQVQFTQGLGDSDSDSGLRTRTRTRRLGTRTRIGWTRLQPGLDKYVSPLAQG